MFEKLEQENNRFEQLSDNREKNSLYRVGYILDIRYRS